MKKIAKINITAFLKEVSEMDADCIGWYTKLILHVFDKGSLPNNTEKLAALCGVNYSNYPRFQRVYIRYIRDKFDTDEKQRLVHNGLTKFMETKNHHVDKRVIAGKKSYLVKFIKKVYQMDDDQINYVKNKININDVDLKNEEKLKEEINNILNDKKVVFLNEKSKMRGEAQGKEKINRLQNLEFRNRVLTFFGQSSTTLKNRAMKYMDEVEDYCRFYQQTMAYMDYIEVTGKRPLSWRRYKESLGKKNWVEEIITMDGVSSELKKVD